MATTPKPTRLLKELIADPDDSDRTRGTTYDNRPHLAKRFYEKIIGRFEGTRLWLQELLAEILEIGEATWFASFDVQKHVVAEAEYHPHFPVHLAIDAGTSRTHRRGVVPGPGPGSPEKEGHGFR